MGSGKTTLGRPLARKLGLAFADMDAYIEQSWGMSVGELFERGGEDGFREIERQALKVLCGKDDIVVSAGGGTPCFFDNMDRMNRCGTTVYLKLSPEDLCSRLRRAKRERPLIRDKSESQLTDYIRRSLAVREPYYSKSHITLEGPDITVEEVAGSIRTRPML